MPGSDVDAELLPCEAAGGNGASQLNSGPPESVGLRPGVKGSTPNTRNEGAGRMGAGDLSVLRRELEV